MLLSYWTVPYVELKDRKLQLFYTLGLAAVLVYVFSSIFLQQGFLELEDVEGFGRPTVRLRAPVPPAPFCETLRCKDDDADHAVVELGTEEVFVTTMVRKLIQESNCSADEGGECNSFRTTEVNAHFVQSVDNFELRVSHNIYCSKFLAGCKDSSSCPFAASGKMMTGRLLGTDGQVLKEIPAGKIPTYPLKEWLAAAGIGLDNTSDALLDDDNVYRGVNPGGNDKQIPTYRFLGFVLLLDFSYSATSGSFMDYVRNKPPLTYDIRVNHIPHTLFKHRDILSEQLDSKTGVGTRVLLRSAGIVIRLSQSGQCARFSWSAMLEKFLVNIGLLGVLTSVIDLVWQFVYPAFGVDYNGKVFKEVDESEAETKDIKSD